MTIFSEKKEGGETRVVCCTIWLLSPRIKSKGQVGPWASLKRFSRNMLYCQALKGQLFQQKEALSKHLISYTTGQNLRCFKIPMHKITEGLWQELRSGTATFWHWFIWDGDGNMELQKHFLVIRDTHSVMWERGWQGNGSSPCAYSSTQRNHFT